MSGANSYTGDHRELVPGIVSQLGVGGTASIGEGAITDAGTHLHRRQHAPITLANPISGVGVLKQIGTGTTSINTANTYTGGATLSAGTLAIGKGGALGTGALTFTGGELLGTATETLPAERKQSLPHRQHADIRRRDRHDAGRFRSDHLRRRQRRRYWSAWTERGGR